MRPIPDWNDRRAHCERLHRAALEAADPARAVRAALDVRPDALVAGGEAVPLATGSRVVLVAFGKASPRMARAALERLGSRVETGVIAHPAAADPGAEWPAGIRPVGAGHPLPDAGSLAAGEAVERVVSGLGPRDVVLALVSGGGSALLERLRPGLGLDDLRAATEALMRSGADIRELNTVRRALSRLKGGGLLRLAAPARVVALLLSDVVGDDPAAIASGPVVPSPTGPAEALEVLARRGAAAAAPRIAAALAAAAADPPADVPAPLVRVVGSNRLAAEAVVAEARALGFDARVLTVHLQGEAREAGRVVGAIARSARETGVPAAPPACLVLGGETTVTVHGGGRGGRNLELALGAARTLAGCGRALVFSFATDGLDGNSGAAGAFAAGDTLERARGLGLDPDRAVAASDTAAFFEALGDAWVTGPSGTNVNDLALALAYP